MNREIKNINFTEFLQTYRRAVELSRDDFARKYVGDLYTEAGRNLWTIFWMLKAEIEALTEAKKIPENEDDFFKFLEELSPDLFIHIVESALGFFAMYVGKVETEYRVSYLLHTPKMMKELHNQRNRDGFQAVMIALLRNIPNDHTAGKFMFVDWLIPNFGEEYPDLIIAVGKEILAMEHRGEISRKIWEGQRLIELYEDYISKH